MSMALERIGRTIEELQLAVDSRDGGLYMPCLRDDLGDLFYECRDNPEYAKAIDDILSRHLTDTSAVPPASPPPS